jgi:hypothetical protein
MVSRLSRNRLKVKRLFTHEEVKGLQLFVLFLTMTEAQLSQTVVVGNPET